MSQPATAAVPRRIGAIDVGTNSIRLTIAETAGDGRYRVLDDEKETTRLGRGLDATGKLDPEAMERSAEAIARMRRIAEGYGVEVLRAVGTCALREAANRDEFLALVRSRADLAVEPIGADAEAQLAHLSVASAFDLRSLAVAVVDIGGGSVEIVLSSGGVVEEIYSLPLGAVRLTEQFGGPDQAAGPQYRSLRRAVRQTLKRTVRRPPFAPQLIIGTGGTFTALAHMALQRRLPAGGPVRPGVRGCELKRSEVRHLLDWLRELPLRERQRVPGLSPDRADIIVAGVAVVERVMKHLGVNRLQVHDGGIRDGLLRTLGRSLFPDDPARAPAERLAAARRFAAQCGFEERHCEHIARLAGRLFDQLAEAFPGGWCHAAHRDVLTAAALLHDVGYLVNYAKHHHHTYHLVAHSDLAGFTPREVELIANVARYHRGADPKGRHAPFARLPKADRKVVRRLAALLRLAAGLDRSRLQRVKDVAVRLQGDTAVFLLDADEDPTVDAWGASRRGRLFQKVFRLKPRFEWGRGPTADGEGAAPSE